MTLPFVALINSGRLFAGLSKLVDSDSGLVAEPDGACAVSSILVAVGHIAPYSAAILRVAASSPRRAAVAAMSTARLSSSIAPVNTTP